MNEIILKIAQQYKIEENMAKQIFTSIFDNISEQLVINSKVQIAKFGTFELKEREARKGYNSKTKEELVVLAKKYPVFRPSASLKNKF